MTHSPVTVAEFWEQYSALILSKVSAGTGRSYLAAWRARVEPRFGSRDIRRLGTLDVEVAFSEWSGAYSTRVDALTVLSRICQVAVKAGSIAANPCSGVERSRRTTFEPSGRALNLDEVRTLLDLLPPLGPYRRFVLALLYTGCRFGEVAALRASDLDMDSGVLMVARTLSPGKGGRLEEGPTKGRKARAVPVVDPLRPVLLEAVDSASAGGYLFTGARGGRLTSRNLSRALGWHDWRNQVKTYPPGEDPFHFHDLRHTAAVLFFLAGIPAPDVQAILGHSSLAVTQLYADTRRDAARRAAVAMSSYWAGS